MITHLVDLRDILDCTGTAIELDTDIEIEDLLVGEEVFVPSGPAHASVQISNVGSGYAAFGSITAPVTATCARCLCSFPLTLDGEVEGLYLKRGQEADDAEEAQQVSGDGKIDLGPALSAALVFAAPFVPLHDESCAGLCAGCGADLNIESCGCDSAPSEDHPFAQLKELLADPSDES